MEVDVKIQDGLFLMAVSNSCMNPLMYGSYAIKCKKIDSKRGSNEIGLIAAVHRRSTGKL